jgi:signal transduction histidine kinase/GGDEF domain-containing protein
MIRSLSGLLVLAMMIVLCVVTLVGGGLGLAELPLTVMVASFGALSLIVIILVKRLLGVMNAQVKDYASRTDPTTDKPWFFIELEPFFEVVVDQQAAARKAKLDASTEVAEQQKWTDLLARSLDALSSDSRLAPRFENLLNVLMGQWKLSAGGFYQFRDIEQPPIRIAWKGAQMPMPNEALSSSAVENDLLAGRVVWIERLSNAPPALAAYAGEFNFTSAIMVPAVADRKTLGVLVLFSTDTRLPSPRYSAFLDSLRQPIAEAWRTGASFEGQVNEVVLARKLNDLFLSFGSSSTLEEATLHLLERLKAYHDFTAGAVLLRDSPETFDVVASKTEGDRYFLGTRLRAVGSCAAACLESGNLRIDDDIRASASFVEDSVLLDEGYASRMVFPLVAGEKQLGVVYLASFEHAAFDTDFGEQMREPMRLVASIIDARRSRSAALDATEPSGPDSTEKLAFLSGLNHEIRNQMRTMMELAEGMLREATLEPKENDGAKRKKDAPATEAARHQIEGLSEILGRSRELLGMLEGVADIERMDVKDINMEEFFVSDAIKDVLFDLQPSIKSRNLDIVWDVPRGLPAIIADVTQFRSMIYQLMHHAAKVTPASGQIAFRANLIPASWLKDKATDFLPENVANSIVTGTNLMIFSIVDQGETLSPETRDQIFKQDLTHTTDPEIIMLRFVRRLVEMHRGHIWMEESPGGRGNRVLVVLPQYSVDEVAFMNYVGRRVSKAREALSCLSLISIGYKERQSMRRMLGEEPFFKAMKELENLVNQAIRAPKDQLRRFSKGDFVVIFAETDKEGARAIVDRVQKRYELNRSTILAHPPDIVSGIVTYPDDAVRTEEVMRRLELSMSAGAGEEVTAP